jgi:hypothetical protein
MFTVLEKVGDEKKLHAYNFAASRGFNLLLIIMELKLS